MKKAYRFCFNDSFTPCHHYKFELAILPLCLKNLKKIKISIFSLSIFSLLSFVQPYPFLFLTSVIPPLTNDKS